jgi:hypothetical protein
MAHQLLRQLVIIANNPSRKKYLEIKKRLLRPRQTRPFQQLPPHPFYNVSLKASEIGF